MNEETKALVRHRLRCSEESLEEARVMAKTSHWRGCVNRLYYSCFYAVLALLMTRGLSSSKHTGVRSLFNRHFVKPGTVSKNAGALYNTLFDKRQEGDYSDFVEFEQEQVGQWVLQTTEFVANLTDLVHRELDNNQR